MCDKKDCMKEDTGNTEKENLTAGNKETVSETIPDRLSITRRDFLAAGGVATGVAVLGGMAVTDTAAAITSDTADADAKCTKKFVSNNEQYVAGAALHDPTFQGPLPILPAERLAVVTCMDARIDVEDALGIQTGDAHIIRNAGGVVDESAIRSLIISHHLLNTNCIMVIHHTRCGMTAFKDDLLKAGLEGDPTAINLLSIATGRTFVSPGVSSNDPAHFWPFRGPLQPLDTGFPGNVGDLPTIHRERLEWDVRRGISRIMDHPWIPTEGKGSAAVKGFVYDVDTGRLEPVNFPDPGPVSSKVFGPFDDGSTTFLGNQGVC